MVAPERESLKREVAVDETLVGGRHSERRGGRQRDGKALVGVAVEVRGEGSGRLRLSVLPDASGDTARSLGGLDRRARDDRPHRRLERLRQAHLARLDHRPIKQRCRHADRQIVLPRAHRVASNLNYSAGNGQPVE